MIQEFKKKLADGHAVFGPFMKTSDTAIVEVTGHAGFDFVILDMEHAPFTYANLQNLVMAAGTLAVVPPIIVFLILQERIVEGMTLAGLKGV